MPRHANDFYSTPPALADFLVQLLVADGFAQDPADILEPSAGAGSFVRPLLKHVAGGTIHAVEPNPLPLSDPCVRHRAVINVHETLEDFAELNGRFDLICGNPPYSLAQEHVELCLGMRAEGGCVAMLLRLAFLESAKRYPFWQEHPVTKLYVLSERPSFTEDGKTDSAAYGFFVWEKNNHAHELEVVSWKP